MEIIRRINNNTVLCKNSKGREFIALGRGIGFPNGPDTIPLERIERTFYGIDDRYLALLDELDPKVLEFSAQIADIARANISRELSPNLPFTLADHIGFAIKRCREHMYVQMPLAYDVQQNYPIEYRIAQMAVNGINRDFDITLPRSEAAGIALCILNSSMSASTKAKSNEARKEERLIEELTKTVEQQLGISVDRDGFDFARYATHLRYLVARVSSGEPLDSQNEALYQPLCEQYPEVSRCAERISLLIGKAYGTDGLTPEEQVYLILHINRLYAGACKDKQPL